MQKTNETKSDTGIISSSYKKSQTPIESIIKIFLPLFLLFFTFTHCCIANAQNEIISLPIHKSPTTEQTHMEGEVIVKYKDDTTKKTPPSDTYPISRKTERSQLSNIIFNALGKDVSDKMIIEDNLDEFNIAKITSDEMSTDELIKNLSKNEKIELIEPNYIRTPTFIPNDTYFFHQWAHRNNGQNISGVTGTNDADIDTTEMWDITNSNSANTIVAVIDSGVDYNHTELSANMWDGTGCVDENGSTIYGGCPYHGWDYANNDNNPIDAGDWEGHGTLISSIISSNTNNNSGSAGMSRYNRIKIMAIRFDSTVFSELKAIDFARHNGAKVINASFSGVDFSQIEKYAIDTFPGVFVTASGNGGSDYIGDSNNISPQYPCNYASSNIICVAATDQNDNLANFSNHGFTTVDIAAPGVNIFGIYKNAYSYGSGTSFSTPFVAGTVALLYSHKPTASISTIKNTLLRSSDHVASLNNISCSRRLNTHRSLQNTINNTIPTEICSIPVHRFWSKKNKSHFYTASEEEKNIVMSEYDDYVWQYEGIAYNTPNNTISGVTPVYRFWSAKHKGHFYTAGENEKNLVISKYDNYVWQYEGIAYYAYPSQQPRTRPVYRFWSAKHKHHFYTASEEEKNIVISEYDDYIWQYEGISWYVTQ